MLLYEYLKTLRGQSLDNKYAVYYERLCLRAAGRASSRREAKVKLGYVEGHHVLPTAFLLGGEKDPENYVFLTAREHFICHLLLTKMAQGRQLTAMLSAFIIMSGRKLYNCNARVYEKLRLAYRDRMAKLKTGRPISEKQRQAYAARKGKPLTEAQQQGYQNRDDDTPARLVYYAQQRGKPKKFEGGHHPNKGKALPEAQRQNISAKLKAFYAKKKREDPTFLERRNRKIGETKRKC
jgi:hypothetical protein